MARKMGSSPSSPVRDVTEKFWVPPAVLERKRAQSLIPNISHHGDSDDGKSLFHLILANVILEFDWLVCQEI